MATKSARKSATTTTTSKAKTLTRPRSARASRPVDIDTRIAAQDAARAAWEKAREGHDAAIEKGRSPEMIAKFAEARQAAWQSFVEARYLRWATLHVERAIARGDGTFPVSLLEDSAGIRNAIIEILESRLAYERARADSDPDMVRTVALCLKGARANLRD